MSFIERTAWAALLMLLWFMLYASITRFADPEPPLQTKDDTHG